MILPLIEKLLDDQEQRHAWLLEAGEKIRRWKEEELAAVSGSSSLRSPEPVPVSAHTGNDPGRKCECQQTGQLNPAYADWYDAELELPFVNHAPGECRCSNGLARYRSSDGAIRWLCSCSCCHTFGDTPLSDSEQESAE